LAALADRWHGAGTGLRLGAVLRFRPQPGPDGLPTVERGVEQQLADARDLLGLDTTEPRRTEPAERIRPGDGCYLVADAYHLPWVPYFGQRHMEHSLLVRPADGDAVEVLDGYHNETPWGSARPGRWTLDRDDFLAALPQGALVARLAPVAPTATADPVVDLAGPAEVARYAAAYAGHPDRVAALHRLTLETWLLLRSRKLHAAHLAATGVPVDERAVADRLHAWEALTEQVYLAYRRVERGRPEPQRLSDRLVELLEGDRAVFGGAGRATAADPATAGSAPSEQLRRTVAEAAAAVLRTEPGPLLDGAPLTDSPAFSSFRIVEIVERLESDLGIEFDPDDLVPEHLHLVDAICRAVLRATPADTAARLVHSGEAR
ncbi:acyl carrier protein, partial [Kitasatospora sp. NPDC036755]|uniref:acyl carrier protein n=1 Tax=Kitasatospora sp. NPDC036755 TaxID=3154600 RepID=UPI0033D3F327